MRYSHDPTATAGEVRRLQQLVMQYTKRIRSLRTVIAGLEEDLSWKEREIQRMKCVIEEYEREYTRRTGKEPATAWTV